MRDHRTTISLPASTPPMLLVVIDTEEEFDWTASFDRRTPRVEAIAEIWRLQEVFEAFGIRPTYVVDYPVAALAAPSEGVAALRSFAECGRAGIGLHLHSWVNPPFEEEPTPANSYQGNLPPDLERRKLTALKAAVEHSFGVRPLVHKAGRYGFGPHTADILRDLGLRIDLSLSPGFDLSRDGGPDYSRCTSDPYWIGRNREILGLPTTGGFVGRLRAAASRLYPLAAQIRLRWAHLPAMLARTGAMERVRLSPEGYTVDDTRRLVRALYADGLRVFTYSLHSPSARPGCTPFVRSEADLRCLLERCRRFCDFFLEELRGVAATPAAVRDAIAEHGRWSGQRAAEAEAEEDRGYAAAPAGGHRPGPA